VTIDKPRAVHWFCLAIAKGNPRGMNNLAIMLNEGDYLTRDEAEARSLWEQSAVLGHANSMANLAFSYAQGTERDLNKAQAWIVRAAQSGQPDAQKVLRLNGYAMPLPPPFYEAAVMIPAPRNEAGHTKVCGDILS
jgi:TPR repeat protein